MWWPFISGIAKMQNHSHNIIDSHIGSRAMQRRNELKISLEDLSLQSGISIRDLYRIEAGQINITAVQVFNLSHSLHVPVDFFFSW